MRDGGGRASPFPESWYGLSGAGHCWMEWRLRVWVRRMRERAVDLAAPARAFDIGCGIGTFSRQVEAASAWTVDGTDAEAAVSRAVRTPSRIDRELVNPGVITPGGFESEYLLAYELGYRTQPTPNSSLSVNLYYHDYEDIRTVNLTPPGVLPARFGNGLEGEI